MSSLKQVWLWVVLLTFDGVVWACRDDVISCPCGSSGDDTIIRIPRCIGRRGQCQQCEGDTYTKETICRQFQNCRTCSGSRDGGCESCPDGMYGKTCLTGSGCGQPPIIVNGGYEGADWEDGDTAVYYCENGLFLTGDSVLVCREGKWSGIRPSCHENHQGTCGQPPNLHDGRYEGTDLTEGAVMDYYCNEGWYLWGDSQLNCQNGRWRGTKPVCIKQADEPLTEACGAPPNLVNGGYNGPDRGEGALVYYYCNSGWRLVGQSYLTCLNRQWAGTKPVCVLQGICTPPIVQNAMFRPVKTSYLRNERIRVTCSSGYSSNGSKSMTLMCLGDDTWNHPAPRCLKVLNPTVIVCPIPPEPMNGRIQLKTGQSTFKPGQRAVVSCDMGYSISFPNTAHCQTDGKWSTAFPGCIKEKICGQPPNLHNGRYEGSTFTEGGVMDYFCNDRWELRGDSQLTCRNGQWTGTRPRCDIVCRAPLALNVDITPKGSSHPINAEITVTCLPGYHSYSQTSKKLTCLRTGVWNTVIPRCVPVVSRSSPRTCSIPPFPENGRVIEIPNQNGFKPGQRADFVCNDGFTVSSSVEIVCQDDGLWSAPFPRCIRTCTDPGTPENSNRVVKVLILNRSRLPVHVSRFPSGRSRSRMAGQIVDDLGLSASPKQFQPSTTLYFSCSSGHYQLKGSPIRTCLTTGEWTGQQPVCIPAN